MNEKLLSLLGIARKAGRLSMGNDAVTEALRRGSASLVLLANDLSPRTVSGVLRMAQEEGIATANVSASIEEMSWALGKRAGIIAVNDDGFAKKMIALNGQEPATASTTNRRV